MFRRLSKPNPLGSPGMQPSRLAQRELRIGHADAAPVQVPVERFAQHLCVTGAPGMGKTTATVGLAADLARRGMSVVVFEPAKVEYAALLRNEGVDCRAFGDDALPGTARLKVNPFTVDEGVKPHVWIEDASSCIVDAYGMAEQPLPLHLEGLIRRLYRLAGIDCKAAAHGAEPWPAVDDFLRQIDPYMCEETNAGKEVTQNVRGALTRRARSMAEAGAFSTRTGLMAVDLIDFGGGARVFQLGDLGPSTGRFVGMVLLSRIVRASRSLGRRDLHTVVVLEEAHSLFVNPLTGEPTMFSRMYENALAELRAAGIGFVTVEQRASQLPAGVLANSVSKLCFACSHGDDRQAVGRALGLDGEQARRLGGLGRGQALFATEGMDGALTIACEG